MFKKSVSLFLFNTFLVRCLCCRYLLIGSDNVGLDGRMNFTIMHDEHSPPGRPVYTDLVSGLFLSHIGIHPTAAFSGSWILTTSFDDPVGGAVGYIESWSVHPCLIDAHNAMEGYTTSKTWNLRSSGGDWVPGSLSVECPDAGGVILFDGESVPHRMLGFYVKIKSDAYFQVKLNISSDEAQRPSGLYMYKTSNAAGRSLWVVGRHLWRAKGLGYVYDDAETVANIESNQWMFWTDNSKWVPRECNVLSLVGDAEEFIFNMFRAREIQRLPHGQDFVVTRNAYIFPARGYSVTSTDDITDALSHGYRRLAVGNVSLSSAGVLPTGRGTGHMLKRKNVFLSLTIDSGEFGYNNSLQYLHNMMEYLNIYYFDSISLRYKLDSGSSTENDTLPTILKESWLVLQRVYTEGFAMGIGLEELSDVSLMLGVWQIASVKPHFYSSPFSEAILAAQRPLIYQFCLQRHIAIISTSSIEYRGISFYE